MHTYVNDSIGALADLFPDNIVVQRGLGREDYDFILLLCDLLLCCNRILIIHGYDILGDPGNASGCVARGGLLWASHNIPQGRLGADTVRCREDARILLIMLVA